MENIRFNYADIWEIVFYMYVFSYVMLFLTMFYEEYMNDYISEKEEHFNGEEK